MRLKMSVSADYRRLIDKEVKTITLILKSFKKQSKFLEANVEELYEKYKYNIEIEWNLMNNEHVHLYPEKSRENTENTDVLQWFRSEMWVDDMIEDLKPQIRKAVEKWYKRRYRLVEWLLIENGFRYYEDIPSNYANHRWELHLSDYKWAISRTTKFDVIKILKNWIDENLTPGEVAKRISDISPDLFSKARARTIAVTELWKAYEYWNYQPIEQLESVWIKMEKKWETCHDAKVRPEHMECEMEWRVRSDYVYPSVWVDIPPWWPNCRCTILYRRAK